MKVITPILYNPIIITDAEVLSEYSAFDFIPRNNVPYNILIPFCTVHRNSKFVYNLTNCINNNNNENELPYIPEYDNPIFYTNTIIPYFTDLILYMGNYRINFSRLFETFAVEDNDFILDLIDVFQLINENILYTKSKKIHIKLCIRALIILNYHTPMFLFNRPYIVPIDGSVIEMYYT